ncbi:type II toxin-antitoxin system RelE/ParE family toxin [Persicitalea sp.]|uniref:type II toxin-antitoxin system RelE family toxin n=1 Tax=Persicitalea sp. TaxID=3100273 RepID=UPI003593FF2C
MVVEIQTKFEKELRKTPDYIQDQTRIIIKKLMGAKSLETAGVDYKMMKGQKKNRSFYRIRVGDYRVGIQYLHPNLIFMRILHRGKVYDGFPPR